MIRVFGIVETTWLRQMHQEFDDVSQWRKDPPAWAKLNNRTLVELAGPARDANQVTEDHIAQIMRGPGASVLNLKVDKKRCEAFCELLLKSATSVNELDVHNNPPVVTAKRAYAVKNDTYFCDVFCMNEQKVHEDRLFGCFSSPPPVSLAACLRGGLQLVEAEAAYPPSLRVIPTTPGVYGWTAYVYPTQAGDSSHEPTPLAISPGHLEAGFLPSVNIRLSTANAVDASSTGRPMWVVVKPTAANWSRFSDAFTQLTGLPCRPMSHRAVPALPMAPFVQLGVEFWVALQEVGDVVILPPEAYHQVLTPPGVTKLARNFVLPTSLGFLEMWWHRWIRDPDLTDDVVVRGCRPLPCHVSPLLTQRPHHRFCRPSFVRSPSRLWIWQSRSNGTALCLSMRRRYLGLNPGCCAWIDHTRTSLSREGHLSGIMPGVQCSSCLNCSHQFRGSAGLAWIEHGALYRWILHQL